MFELANQTDAALSALDALSTRFHTLMVCACMQIPCVTMHTSGIQLRHQLINQSFCSRLSMPALLFSLAADCDD